MQQTVGGEAEALNSLYLAVSRFAQDLDPNALSPTDAKRVLESAARAKSVLAVIEAMALVRIDETNAYKSSGHRSAADYGAAKTGGSRGDAQRAIKTAKRARRLPNTDEAMRRGDLSPRQADEIADAASVNPDAESDLLRSAKVDDLGTLKKKAKRAKFSADRDHQARMRRIHAKRSVRHWTDEEGAFHAHLTTTPDAGARFLAGLEPHRKAAFDAARKAGRREAPEAYLADALDALARGGAPAATDDVNPTTEPTTGPARRRHTDSSTSSEPTDSKKTTIFPSADGPAHDDATGTRQQNPERKPATKPAPPPNTVHFHVDLAAYTRGHLEPGDICEIPGIGPVPLATIRAALGDATVELILKNAHDIGSVVHLSRTVTADQRRAIEARDPCCIRPGCGRTQHLQIDHRTGWAINKITTLSDLARLCPYCHYLKTHCGHWYTGEPGNWQWHTPDNQNSDETDPDPPEPSRAPPEQAELFGQAS